MWDKWFADIMHDEKWCEVYYHGSVGKEMIHFYPLAQDNDYVWGLDSNNGVVRLEKLKIISVKL